MTPQFERYLSDCKRLGFKPTMTETQVLQSLGITKNESHTTIDPMILKPRNQVVKKSLTVQKYHPVEVTEVVPPKQKAVKQPKPKAPPKLKPIRTPRVKKTPKELLKRKSDTQKAYYRRTVGKEVKAQSVPRTSLIGMTDEQKRAHKTKLRQLRDERKREAGLPLQKRTEQGRENQRKYWATYYEKNKNDPEYIAKVANWKSQRKAKQSTAMTSAA